MNRKKSFVRLMGIALMLSGVAMFVLSWYALKMTGVTANGPEPHHLLIEMGSRSAALGLFVWLGGRLPHSWYRPLAYDLPGMGVENEELEEIMQETVTEELDERGEQIRGKAALAAIQVLGVCLWMGFQVCAALSIARYFRPWSTYGSYFFLGLELLGASTFFAAKRYWNKRM